MMIASLRPRAQAVARYYPVGDLPRSLGISVFPALALKLAKHLAVLACMAIVGKATGRYAIGAGGIFLLVVFAALLHSAGRVLAHRWKRKGNRPLFHGAAAAPLRNMRRKTAARSFVEP